MLLRLDLALGAQPHPHEQPAHDLAQPGLGQKQEIVVGAPQDDERRDHARLGRKKERGARLTGR